MKRSVVALLALAAAGALFAGLVYAVLLAAQVSEPAATTVYGPTLRRLWATSAAGLTLLAVGIGGLALARPGSRIGTASGPLGAVLALPAHDLATVPIQRVKAEAHGNRGSGDYRGRGRRSQGRARQGRGNSGCRN